MDNVQDLIERVARAINPQSFKSHEEMIAYCLAHGDDEATARQYADSTYGPTIEKARSDARAALAASGTLPAQSDAVAAERERIADWFEGKGGVIPGAAAFAPLVSGNNQPCMSGDLRDRLRPQQRERFDAVMRAIAKAIRGAK